MKKNYVAALLLCTASDFHAQQEIYFNMMKQVISGIKVLIQMPKVKRII